MALHCRPTEGKTPMDLKEKFSLQEQCQNNMKITFPTTEMQPPLAWDLPDFRQLTTWAREDISIP